MILGQKRPKGETILAHLDKSHVTVHTYPEYHPETSLATFRVDIDVSTCGEISPLLTLDYLIGQFDSDIITMDYRVRGFTRDVTGKKLFIHSKMMVADDNYAVVGSINLDYRSLYLHFECAAYLYRCKVITKIKKDILNTISESEEMTYDDCLRLNKPYRFWLSLVRLYAPLL